jgi:hypothetical protein
MASAEISPINKTSLTAEKLAKFIMEGGLGGEKVHNTPIVKVDEAEAKTVAEYAKKLKYPRRPYMRYTGGSSVPEKNGTEVKTAGLLT